MISRYIIGFMVINWVVEMRYIAKIKRILSGRRRIHILLFVIFYLLYLTGLLYSHNMDYGRFDIQVKLSLGVFPLLFATFEPEIFRVLKIRYLFLAFIAGCLFASIVCTVHALFRYSQTGDAGFFYYTRFTILHHAAYFAMFLSFAVVVILQYIRENFQILVSWKKVVIAGLLVYFNLVVVLLASKMGIISLVVVYLLFTFIVLARKEEWRMAPLPALLLVVLVGLMLMSPATMERVETATNLVGKVDSLNPESEESTGERILVWQSSVQIIREHPFFGVGTGDVKDALVAEYARRGITYAFSRRLDAHNQYLQTYLSLGIIGFLALLTMLAWPAVIALRRRDSIYFFFILLFSLNILTESMFENQAGVVFYGFFNALLFWSMPECKG